MSITEKPLIIRHHVFKEPSKPTSIVRSSITQRLIPESRVYIPQLFVSDPIGVNPNSIVNV